MSYVDRYLRFPNRVAAASLFRQLAGIELAEGQGSAGGEGWAAIEPSPGGVMWTRGSKLSETTDEDGEVLIDWIEEPRRIEGYHINFTIRTDLPRAPEILAAIDASGFAVAVAEPRVRWARD